MLLFANVHPFPIVFVLYFFSLSCLPQNLMSEYFHFSPSAETLHDDA